MVGVAVDSDQLLERQRPSARTARGPGLLRSTGL